MHFRLLPPFVAGWVLALLFLPGISRAIPQSFGGFFNLAGMAFEDFVNQAAIWHPVLPQADWWKPLPVTQPGTTVEELQTDAVVFGLGAARITRTLQQDRILRFEVAYPPEISGRQVATQAAAWSEGAPAEHVSIRVLAPPEPPVRVLFEPRSP